MARAIARVRARVRVMFTDSVGLRLGLVLVLGFG